MEAPAQTPIRSIPPPPPPPPPPLMDELVEEILLRLPPESPASLVRAGLVCKRWCHLVSDPGFQRRFREHHRSPPILGFVNTCPVDGGDDGDGDGDTYDYATSLVPEPGSGLRRVHHPRRASLECRHGRVLLYSYPYHCLLTTGIVVWDPITGQQVQLPEPPPPPPPFLAPETTWIAAVLCAAAAAAAAMATSSPSGGGTCDHLDCHGGPFIVVLLVKKSYKDDDDLPMASYVYSSESGAWSEPMISSNSGGGGEWFGWLHSSLLVGTALYFVPLLRRTLSFSILQYDLGTREITAVNPPKEALIDGKLKSVELIATKDGRLGFASVVEKTKLSLWSREVDGRWALCQVIDLYKLLPVDGLIRRDNSKPYQLFGSAGCHIPESARMSARLS